jgi:hypothetical protein
MGETDPEELADELDHEADKLERHSEELGRRTEGVAQEWQRKRDDPGVPGAPPPEGDEDDDGPPTGAPTGKSADD